MHRPTDALRRARATHKERDSDEDMDRTFDVDKPPYNWSRDNDDSGGDEEDGEGWHDCDSDIWTDDRSVAQIVAYASTFDNWETLAAHAVIATAVVLSDSMFLVRDDNGLSLKTRYRSLGYRHVGGMLDGMINGFQRAKGAINWADEFVRNEVGYSGALANVLGALDGLELVKFDAETGSADRDSERIDAVNRFRETLFGALGSSAAHAFSAETAVAILGDLALGCSELRPVTLTLAEKIMIAQCNHGTAPRGNQHFLRSVPHRLMSTQARASTWCASCAVGTPRRRNSARWRSTAPSRGSSGASPRRRPRTSRSGAARP